MRIPERIICDLCEQEIDDNTPHAHVMVPMTAEQVQSLVDAGRAVTPGAPVEMVIATSPQIVTLELHAECLGAVSPKFAERAAHVLEQVIAKGIERSERRRAARAAAHAATPAEDHDDAQVTRPH